MMRVCGLANRQYGMGRVKIGENISGHSYVMCVNRLPGRQCGLERVERGKDISEYSYMSVG